MRTRKWRQPKGDPGMEFRRHRSREWHIQFTLPWEVWVGGVRMARFKAERDARGFAKARYGSSAEIINMQQDEPEDSEQSSVLISRAPAGRSVL